MPQVGIYNSPDINAFATGPSKSRSLVAVSTGLLERMDRNEAECLSVPRDFTGLKKLMRSHLDYFDAHAISWSASSFTPGRLIFSMNSMEPTQLYKEVACGAAENPAQGIGLTVQLHQWSMTEDNLITSCSECNLGKSDSSVVGD